MLGLLGRPESLLAHGALRSSTPAAGDSLNVAPRELRLTFTEPVEAAVTRLELMGPMGRVALASFLLHPDSATVLVAPILGPLVAGVYTVRWQVTGTDGHPVADEYSFVISPDAGGLATHPAGPGAPGQPPLPTEHHAGSSFPAGTGFDAESPSYAMVRWLTFLGLVGLIGVVCFRWVVLRIMAQRGGALEQALAGTMSERAAGFGLWMAGLVTVAALLRLYSQSYALHGEAALDPALIGTMLSRTVWGWGWLLQATSVALAFVGLTIARRGDTSESGSREPARAVALPIAAGGGEAAETRRTAFGPGGPAAREIRVARGDGSGGSGWVLAALAVLTLGFTPAFSGHAVAAPALAPAAILADGLHVIGAGSWLGSLLLVVAVGIPIALRHGRDHGGAAVASLVDAFSTTALISAALVVVTGVVSAWLHLGSGPALWESAYGRTLLLKLALLSVVFVTGAYNWRWVRPALGDRNAAGRLSRSATVELATGVAVLAVTAVLVATPPPEADQPATSVTAAAPVRSASPPVEFPK